MDRKKIIKGLKCCSAMSGDECRKCPYEDECRDTDSPCGMSHLAGDAFALLEKQSWIKCSDGMPEEHETIFVKFKGTDKWYPGMFERGSEDVRVVIVFADGTRRVSHSHTIDGEWACESRRPKRTVTHWMPNPELPEE